jgi:sugar/nucleoside kinase (ribokinase family)
MSRDPAKRDRGGIVCLGNFIVDRIHTLDYWPSQGNLAHIRKQDIGMGGGAANVSADLISLGFTGRLSAAGAVGDDEDGRFVREGLMARGIDIAGLRTLPGEATAHTHVMNVPGEGRTFFYHGGANDYFDHTMFDPADYASQGFRFLYLGYLMLMPGLDRPEEGAGSGAARLLAATQAAGLLTVVDFVSSEDPAFATQVGHALPYCDYVVINETEAGRATNRDMRRADGALDVAGLRRSATDLLDAGVSRAVIVHAPELCLWQARGESPLIIPSVPVRSEEIVSAVGAGDAFCAAVLYGLHEGWAADLIAQTAHRVAARSLSGKTATDGIPSMTELLR